MASRKRQLTCWPCVTGCGVVLLAGLLAGCGDDSSAVAGAAMAPPPKPVVSLLAGTLGGAGFLDGAGTGARFNNPKGLARDAAGNLIVADTGNNAIRRISPTGQVTTLVGSDAGLRSPEGVVVDRQGNIDIADTASNVIRQLKPDGSLSVLAGAVGDFGTVDGVGKAARFVHPHGLAVDSLGFVIVADTETVRRIAPDGTVTTLSGRAGEAGTADGPADKARFKWASAVAADSKGNVYVADAVSATLRRISATGQVTTIAGVAGKTGSQDGAGRNARFTKPTALAVDADGTVYVADGSTVRRVDASGVVTTLAGRAFASGADDGPLSLATLQQPAGLIVDGSASLTLADAGSNTIRHVAGNGIITIAGAPGVASTLAGVWPDDHLHHPAGLAADPAGNILVADDRDGTLRRIMSNGSYTTLVNLRRIKGPADLTSFAAPAALAVCPDGGIVFSDGWAYTLGKVISPDAVSVLAGTPGVEGAADGAGQGTTLAAATAMTSDAAGNVYFADTRQHVVRKLTREGRLITLAGQPGKPGVIDGNGLAARFNTPAGIAIDAQGNLYVSDASHTIRRITPAGDVSTFAGQTGRPGAVDGQGTMARFNYPSGLAIDRQGNLFVADTGNSALRKITPAGVVSTVVGGPDRQGVTLGAGGSLNQPRSVAVDVHGAVYVSSESAVLRIRPVL